MKVFFVILVLLAPLATYANEIQIGEENFFIPTPPGYAPVTRGMSELYENQKIVVAQNNLLLKNFIPENLATTALKGEMPTFKRYYSVQTSRAILHRAVSIQDFPKVKAGVKKTIERSLESQSPKISDGINSKYYERHGANLSFEFTDTILLPAHYESMDSISFSIIGKFNFNDSNGKLASEIATGTATALHLKDKVLFIYTYGSDEDLDWTREANSTWVAKIKAAN